MGKALNENPHQNYAMLYQDEDKIVHILDYIESRYVDTVSRSKLEESAIPAMLEELDKELLIKKVSLGKELEKIKRSPKSTKSFSCE